MPYVLARPIKQWIDPNDERPTRISFLDDRSDSKLKSFSFHGIKMMSHLKSLQIAAKRVRSPAPHDARLQFRPPSANVSQRSFRVAMRHLHIDAIAISAVLHEFLNFIERIFRSNIKAQQRSVRMPFQIQTAEQMQQHSAVFAAVERQKYFVVIVII